MLAKTFNPFDLGDRPLLESFGLHLALTALCATLTALTSFRAEYIAMTVFWAILTFVGPRGRQFLALAVPFLLVGLLYDKILPLLSGLRGEIHVRELYDAELSLFGISTAEGLVTPSHWLNTHPTAFLDVLCGVGYLSFMFQSFACGAWLFFSDRPRATRFGWAFLIANMVGMACELIYPAAPPWYIELYGLGPARLDVMASPAGTARFDAFFGIDYFSSFYSRSKDVFGAMPSLHVAYPVMVLAATWFAKPKWVRWVALAFALDVAFAAVYLDHHFILDVIAGIAVGLGAYAGTVVVMRRLGLERYRVAPVPVGDATMTG